MAKAKATHHGECQVCGSMQKLPGGTLAAHGYTVRWGFFSGVCRGSHNLPWEQDKSLVEGAVSSATQRLASIRATQAALRTPATQPKAWVGVYIPATWENRRSRTEWREVELTADITSEELGKVLSVKWTDEGGKDHKATTYKWENATVLDHATELNRFRADQMEREAAQIEEYIAWQQKRLSGWAPRELRPVSKVA